MNPETLLTMPRVDDNQPFDGSRWNRLSNWLNGDQAIAASIPNSAGDTIIGINPTATSSVTLHGVATFAAAGITFTAPTTLTTLHATGAVDLDTTLNVDGATTLTSLHATGAVDLDTTLNVDGATTMTTLGTSGLATLNSASITTTLGVTGATTLTGALTANGAVTLGNAAGDVITVTGTATFAQITTFSLGVVLTAGPLSIGATPATAGTIRGENLFSIVAKAAGGNDALLLDLNASNDINLGETADVNAVRIRAAAVINASVNGVEMFRATTVGVGFNSSAAVAPPSLTGSAAALYDATTQQLINDIRDCLQDNGLAT